MEISTFRKLWQILSKGERRDAIALLGLMTVGMAFETFGVSLIIPVIALLTQPNYMEKTEALMPVLEILGYPSQQMLLLGTMLALTCVYLVKNLFLVFLASRQTQFTFGIQARLSQKLFTTYLCQPYTFHLQRNSAQLLRNAITEVGYITGRVLTPTLLLLTEGLVVFGLCCLLFVVEAAGTAAVVIVLGGTAMGFHRVTRSRTSHWARERQHHEGLRIQHLQQGLGGAKEIKLLGRESYFAGVYGRHNSQSARAGRYHAMLQQLTPLGLEFLAIVGLVSVVLTMVTQGRELSSIVPVISLFGVVAFRLIPSTNRILLSIQSLRYGLPAIDTLHADLNLFVPENYGAHSAKPLVIQDEIRLHDVSYTYPATAAPSLTGVSLVIHKGESVGFIGPSGSGKSTLVNVLLGLLTPDSGEVKVDGWNIQANLRDWQGQIGYVPQSIYLTDDTLLHNVAFGIPREQISLEAVERAILAAQLTDFVAGLPAGLETVVGERGVKISGGQRQRIGIARALYHDPYVLVLDEATSALDTVTEEGVMEAVRAFHGLKTTIIVAHRLSTVEHCDRLVRFDHGCVVEKDVRVNQHSRRIDLIG